MDDATKRAAAYWSAGPAVLMRTRWWESHTIVSKINELIGGAASAGTEGGDIDLLTRLAAGKPYVRDRAESDRANPCKGRTGGPGVAHRGGVRGMHSPTSTSLNTTSSIGKMRCTTCRPRSRRSAGAMGSCGPAACPTRMQWTERQLDLVARVPAALPMDYLRNPRAPEAQVPLRRTRPTIEGILASDPSECADSASILPSLRARFPDAHVIPTGCIVYMLALNAYATK